MNRTYKGLDRILNRDVLHDKYWSEGLTLAQIGELYNVNAAAIRYWMCKFSIPRRPSHRMKLRTEEYVKLYERGYRNKHRKRINERKNNWQRTERKRNIEDWRQWLESIYGTHPDCRICKKPLKFLGGNKEETVHFDHRRGGMEPIKKSPYTFLSNRRCTEYNQSIFEQCDFGFLCFKCNSGLPESLELRDKIVEYINGNKRLHDGIAD